MVRGRDEPDVGRGVHRLTGDLTVLADGRLALVTPDEEVHDLGDVLAALVGEAPDRVPSGRATATSAGCASRSRWSTATSG
jgi:hypothetical protein